MVEVIIVYTLIDDDDTGTVILEILALLILAVWCWSEASNTEYRGNIGVPFGRLLYCILAQ